MNRRISLGAAISFMAVVAAITFTITMIFSQNIFNDKVYNVCLLYTSGSFRWSETACCAGPCNRP